MNRNKRKTTNSQSPRERVEGARSEPARDAATVAVNIARTLRGWRDPARAEGVQRYFKHSVVALGIDSPTLRAFSRRQIEQLRNQWTVETAVTCCESLLRQSEMELRGCGLLLLAGFNDQLTPAFLTRAEAWLRTRLDNWALVDSFCGLILGPLLQRNGEVVGTLAKWSHAESLWVRRAALVTLVPFARRGQYLDLAYSFAAEHFHDTEDLMHKATGWLLREAGKTDPERLGRFLRRRGREMPRTALRYAIERFRAPERAALLRETRRESL